MNVGAPGSLSEKPMLPASVHHNRLDVDDVVVAPVVRRIRWEVYSHHRVEYARRVAVGEGLGIASLVLIAFLVRIGVFAFVDLVIQHDAERRLIG